MEARSIGQYRVTGILGKGGMGVVYAAEHTLLDRLAAVKVLLPKLSGDEEIVTRFFNEARAATAIRHPGIVEVYDFGWTGEGAAFIVMEHLQGETLSARRRRGRIRWSTALAFVRQIAGALDAAHAKGIVHRDLKPANIFLVPDAEVPGGERIKLLDFGIAKLAGTSTSQHMTRTGTVIGTPTYMAPEQCRGIAVDARADLYALGCILFELCTGQPPFVREGEGDILVAHIHDPPPTIASLVSSVPPEVDALVQRLLAKSPAQRIQTAADVIRLIDAAKTAISQVAHPNRNQTPLSGIPVLEAPVALDDQAGLTKPGGPMGRKALAGGPYDDTQRPAAPRRASSPRPQLEIIEESSSDSEERPTTAPPFRRASSQQRPLDTVPVPVSDSEERSTSAPPFRRASSQQPPLEFDTVPIVDDEENPPSAPRRRSRPRNADTTLSSAISAGPRPGSDAPPRRRLGRGTLFGGLAILGALMLTLVRVTSGGGEEAQTPSAAAVSPPASSEATPQVAVPPVEPAVPAAQQLPAEPPAAKLPPPEQQLPEPPAAKLPPPEPSQLPTAPPTTEQPPANEQQAAPKDQPAPEKEPVVKDKPSSSSSSAPVRADGTRKKPAHPTVKLMIRSNPPGARVWVNDVLEGATPLDIERPQGDALLTLELRLPGYKTESHPILPNRSSTITANLTKLPSAQASPAAPPSPGGATTGAAAPPAQQPSNVNGSQPSPQSQPPEAPRSSSAGRESKAPALHSARMPDSALAPTKSASPSPAPKQPEAPASKP